MRRSIIGAVLTACIVVLVGVGCGGNLTLLNPAFLNFVQGGQFPLTPGPGANFVLVRVLNKTTNFPISFVVTADITRASRDEEGNLQFDESGNLVTESVLQTHRLQTFPVGNAAEAGVLFECGDQAIERVGLGENLLPSDRGIFLNAQAGGQAGLGVQAGVNPLVRSAGNFSCGDTVVFEAIDSIGVPGNVKVRSFLLLGSEQPGEFSGPDTFRNYQEFLQSQIREDEP
jgi:hypothetical protein